MAGVTVGVTVAFVVVVVVPDNTTLADAALAEATVG